MPEYVLNMHCGHTCGHQMRGVTVTKGVRSCPHIEPCGLAILFDEKLDGAD